MKSPNCLVLAGLAASLVFCIASAPVRADGTPQTCSPPNCAPPGSAKGPQPGTPDVPLPFTFKCAHCGMSITIKKAADWSKGCFACACGSKNIDCYEQTLKKPAK